VHSAHTGERVVIYSAMAMGNLGGASGAAVAIAIAPRSARGKPCHTRNQASHGPGAQCAYVVCKPQILQILTRGRWGAVDVDERIYVVDRLAHICGARSVFVIGRPSLSIAGTWPPYNIRHPTHTQHLGMYFGISRVHSHTTTW
jgi:hypothetical protein